MESVARGTRKSREDWLRHALEVLRTEGIQGVRIRKARDARSESPKAVSTGTSTTSAICTRASLTTGPPNTTTSSRDTRTLNRLIPPRPSCS